MRGTIAAALWLLLASPVQAASFAAFSSAPGVVTSYWAPNTDGVTVGYRLYYGRASQDYETSVDAGSLTTLVVSGLTPGTRYYFVVRAYNAVGTIGPPSNEVALTLAVLEDPCAYPLGAKSISIFPTKLTTTGSGQGGSKARLDFQVASSIPITRVAIRTMGADIAVMSGTDLTALAGMWFPVPAAQGTYNFSIGATNGLCPREQTTTYAITVR